MVDSSTFPRKVTSESIRTTDAELLLQELQIFIMPCFSIKTPFSRIIEGTQAKNLVATLLSVDFFKRFHTIHIVKMEQILFAYGIPNETVAARKMLYKNRKAMVRLPDGDTDYFDIVTWVLLGDKLAPYLLILCLYYVLRTSIGLLKKKIVLYW